MDNTPFPVFMTMQHAQRIVDHLGKMPFSEVADLIGLIKNSADRVAAENIARLSRAMEAENKARADADAKLKAEQAKVIESGKKIVEAVKG